MAFDVGALVKARGWEWVVQPESGEDLLLLRPLGDDDQVAGIYCFTIRYPVGAALPEPGRTTVDRMWAKARVIMLKSMRDEA